MEFQLYSTVFVFFDSYLNYLGAFKNKQICPKFLEQQKIT